MKRVTYFLIFIIVLASCSTGEPKEKTITVSIQPFSYFTEGIVKDRFKINVVVPPGASPATYEPAPSVVEGILNSEAIIFNGYLGFELAWMEKLKSVKPGIRTILLSENVDLIAAEGHNHDGHMHYSGVDPHYWMSPNIALRISEDIRDLVIDIDPSNRDEYEQNWGQLVLEIKATRAYLDSVLIDMQSHSFMIFHPSLGYLARDYGLVQVPVEVEGKEPSPSDLKMFIDKGRRENIHIIFVQKEFDKKNAMTIARELDAELVVIDPLSENWNSSIREIADIISKDMRNNKLLNNE